MLSPERIQENRTRNVPSGKMLLERFGLNQCQGNCVQLFQSKSRIHLEGVSVIVPQVAKHPSICSHRWNPNPKRARKRYDYSVWIGFFLVNAALVVTTVAVLNIC